MPRYHFHLTREDERILDPAGVDLPDDAAALSVAREVVAEARDRHHDDIGSLGAIEGWELVIVDAAGRQVATVPLALGAC